MKVGTLGDGTIVHIELKFLVTIICSIISIVILFLTLRGDVLGALTVSAENSAAIRENQGITRTLELKLMVVDSKVSELKSLYEYDRQERLRKEQ